MARKEIEVCRMDESERVSDSLERTENVKQCV